MKYLVFVFFSLSMLYACDSGEPREQQQSDTTSIGVDSTKVGADSGILRKLP